MFDAHKTMGKRIKILIVDDHPMIVEGYKNALLNSHYDDGDLIIHTANTCDTAISKMMDAVEGIPYDIMFLDIKLPPSADGQILSGEELGIEAKKMLPKSKVVILTMFNDNFRLNNILKNVDPDGFLIKTDVTSQEFVNAFEQVLKKPPYYSTTIAKLLRQQITNDIILDGIDRKILYQISIGTKVKDIPNFVTVSIGSVERRKRQLKKLFKVSDEDDRALIEKAKIKGFI